MTAIFSVGEVDRVMRQAHLEEEQARLSGDYSRAMDHIGNCDEANTAITVTSIANQFGWDRYRARRVVRYLKGVVLFGEQLLTPTLAADTRLLPSLAFTARALGRRTTLWAPTRGVRVQIVTARLPLQQWIVRIKRVRAHTQGWPWSVEQKST